MSFRQRTRNRIFARNASASIYDDDFLSRGFNQGGYRNVTSGAGGRSDKSRSGIYTPSRFPHHVLQTTYVESWAAKAFIDIPVDDMFIRWRDFNADNDTIERMQEAERKHAVQENLMDVLKGARLYGSAMLLILTDEAPTDEPLDITRLRKDCLLNLLPINRYNLAQYPTTNNDPFSKEFNKMEYYDVMIPGGVSLRVHSSRVIRFDGIKPLSAMGWNAGYDFGWGVSELIPVYQSILDDAAVCSAIAQLAQEASMAVFKLSNFRETLAMGKPEIGDVSPEDVATHINTMKSIFGSIYMDSEDEFDRINVQFSGLPDLMDRFSRRMAAAAKIPYTRFMGTPAEGMNATGEGDARDYAMQVSAMQKRLLTQPLVLLDQILAIDGDFNEAPPYSFGSLIDISDMEVAELTKVKAEIVATLFEKNLIDENEGRAIMDGDPMVGDLDDIDIDQWREDLLPPEQKPGPDAAPFSDRAEPAVKNIDKQA